MVRLQIILHIIKKYKNTKIPKQNIKILYFFLINLYLKFIANNYYIIIRYNK